MTVDFSILEPGKLIKFTEHFKKTNRKIRTMDLKNRLSFKKFDELNDLMIFLKYTEDIQNIIHQSNVTRIYSSDFFVSKIEVLNNNKKIWIVLNIANPTVSELPDDLKPLKVSKYFETI